MKTPSLSLATRIDDRRALSMHARSTHADGNTGEDFEVALLNKMASRMSAAAPLRDVLNDVVQFVMAVVKCDSCMVYVLERDELVLGASRNAHPDAVDRLKMKMG